MLIFASNYFEHMPRNKCTRHIECQPNMQLYKPVGVPFYKIQKVIINLDEFEAIRLADFKGMYQEDAAMQMKISRQTFGRILTEAHYKIAKAFIEGKAIEFEQTVVPEINITNIDL